MADEDQMVTDEDLDRAAEMAPDTSEPEPKVADGTPAEDDTPAEPAGEEEVVEEEVAEEVVEEPIPDEPEGNRERSELGRKVKEQGERLDSFMDTITGAIDEIKTSVAKPEFEDEPLDDDYPITLTAKELNDRIKEGIASAGVVTKKDIETQKRQAKEYENGYLAKVSSLTTGIPDKEAIEKELFENKDVNVKRSNNPLIDAEMNFLKAQTNVLNKKLEAKAKPVNPLDKNNDNEDLPLGGPLGTNNQDVKSEKVTKLDPEAAKFAKESGMSEEDVQKTLAGPMPTYLGG